MKDESDNASRHILVDAGELSHFYVEPGLLEYLAPDPILRALREFQDSARRLPVTVIAALDDEYAVLVVDDDAGDANRVLGCVRHCCLLTFVTVR